MERLGTSAARLVAEHPWVPAVAVAAGASLALIVVAATVLLLWRRVGRKSKSVGHADDCRKASRYDAEAGDKFDGEPLDLSAGSGRLYARKTAVRSARSPLIIAGGVVDSYAALTAAVAQCGGESIDSGSGGGRQSGPAAWLGATWRKHSLPAHFAQVPKRAKSESVLQRMASLATSTGALSIGFDQPLTMDPAVAASQPQLDFGLQHDVHDERLAIYVRGARNLRPELDGRPADCHLRVIVVRDLKKGWVRKRPSGISVEDLTVLSGELDMVDMRTQTIRRALNPQFNEYFSVELRDKHRKYAVVKFALYYVDRKGRDILVGDTYHSVGRFDLSKLTDFTKPLKAYRPEIGEILVTLAYLPTAERLSMTIGKLTHLHLPQPLSTSQELPNVSVKMTLLHRGKKMERQRTHTVRRCANPAFDSTHSFDLPHGELERASVLIAAIHHETGDRDSGRESSGSGERADAMRRRTESVDPSMGRRRSFTSLTDITKATDDCNTLGVERPEKSVTPEPWSCVDEADADKHIDVPSQSCGMKKTASADDNVGQERRLVLGRLLLGCGVAAGVGTERAHWMEVVRSPRAPIAHWHKLVP